MKLDFHDVEATLLIALWARAKFSREYPSIFNDEKAIALVDRLDYDFSANEAAWRLEGALVIVARATQLDNLVRTYIGQHPQASVINIGAGLDTAFYRVDNGSIRWYDLDLPDVIEARRRVLPEPERTAYLSTSLFDAQWCSDVTDTNNGVFLSAGGVLEWFDEVQVKRFFPWLADHFPHAEIALNSQSRMGRIITNWSLRRAGMKDIATKWVMRDAGTMATWDTRIEVMDQFPMFKNFPRDPAWGVQIKRLMNLADRGGMYKIVHLRI